ncbi:hypothetical protein QBC35DRAFT_413475 [Podospora australis]|uniref:DUF7580 domain-containing protein n=1 Tax=Podospora australis TaxID=1536484 RepID=A0AAN6WTR8_9PEZI|nr:hypothetical protein QBC35DRAFT_413475 [Podospora australis]
MAEIAGLVLAVTPLLISALEHYEDAVEPVIAFFRWRQQLPKVIRELYMGHTSYEQNLRLLLSDTVDKAELGDMIDNPRSEHWKDQTLIEALQDKLGTAYEPCLSTINEIADIMVMIAKCLNIDGNCSTGLHQQTLTSLVIANPPISNATVFRARFCFKQRMDFTMNRKSANALLAKLQRCNTRLYEFIEKAEKLQSAVSSTEAPSTTRLRIQFVAPLELIRGNASHVHSVLSHGWCDSHAAHHAGLRLEQRLVRRGRNRSSLSQDSFTGHVGKSDCFGVSLLRSSMLSWIDTEFHIDEKEIKKQTSPGRRVRKVAFSVAEPPTEPAQQLQPLPEVKNICSTIESLRHPFLGFRLRPSQKLIGPFEILSTPSPILSDKCTTLQDVLPVIRHEDFSLPDLYTLAITLVSSILQLSQTPWLQQSWSKQTIQFLRLRDGCLNDAVDIKQPYLSQVHHIQNSNKTSAPVDHRNQQLDRRNMLALAIMLLEINSGVPIENMRSKGNSQPSEIEDLVTASRWLNTRLAMGRMTRQFADAITYCLQCYVDPFASFGNPEFSKSVEEKVLGPLESEMQYLYGR